MAVSESTTKTTSLTDTSDEVSERQANAAKIGAKVDSLFDAANQLVLDNPENFSAELQALQMQMEGRSLLEGGKRGVQLPGECEDSLLKEFLNRA